MGARRLLTLAAVPLLATALFAPAAAATPQAPALSGVVAGSLAPAAAPRQFTSAPRPVFKVTYLQPGQTISLALGTWSPAPSGLYISWYRVLPSGKQVLLQTGRKATYTIQHADLTSRIAVAVAAVRTGYATTTRRTGNSGHVLIPAQRFLRDRTGSDWQDFYKTGTGSPANPEVTVAIPNQRRFAFIGFTCTSALGDWYRLQLGNTANKALITAGLGDGSANVSNLWMYADAAKNLMTLDTVKIRCTGAWTLNVRPPSSAPVSYSTVNGTGSRLYVYAGPSVKRTFSRPLKEYARFEYVGNSYLNVKLTEAETVTSKPGQVPAGPAFLAVTATSSWKIA